MTRMGACAAYQDRVLRNLPCKRIQVDEIWSFVYAKHMNLKNAKAAPRDAGDIWTWTAICADTKLASWYVGDRTSTSAIAFLDDLKERLASRVQLTSDGHRAYLDAVDTVFGRDIDYGGPRIIATDRQAPRICPRMIPLCSRFDSVLFTPKMFRIASYGDYSRSPSFIFGSPCIAAG